MKRTHVSLHWSAFYLTCECALIGTRRKQRGAKGRADARSCSDQNEQGRDRNETEAYIYHQQSNSNCNTILVTEAIIL